MRISSNDSVVFLMGPTASGKTELALEIFDRFDVCLISVDSALIYRGMDIGTAKPSPETLENYPHALIDICEPEEAFSVNHFVNLAKEHIDLALKEISCQFWWVAPLFISMHSNMDYLNCLSPQKIRESILIIF